MLHSVKLIYGDRIGATDGEIGQVKDFYFDDRRWTIRYLVADTGSWLTGLQVLITPLAFSSLYPGGKVMIVNLTRKQIENSPSIDTHKPISRQFEEEYFRYYGWPFYWEGNGLWGMTNYPILSDPAVPLPGEDASTWSAAHPADAHLRSTRAVCGHVVRAGTEDAGKVVDFLVDDGDWRIRNLVVDTGRAGPAKLVLISPDQIERMRWDEATVFVNLTRDEVFASPVWTEVPAKS